MVQSPEWFEIFFGSAHEVFDQGLETQGFGWSLLCEPRTIVFLCRHGALFVPAVGKSSFILMLTEGEWGPVATALSPQG